MQTDVDSVFFATDDFAEVIKRYIGGEKGAVEFVTALVTWNPTGEAYERDRATRRTGELLLKDSQSVTVADTFKVGTDRIQVTAVGPIQDGARTVYFSQYIPEIKGGAPLRTGDL